MRQALSYAVDKKAIVAAVFKDSGTPANSLLPPGMLGYNDQLPEYAYDPQKARELLKQAGLEQGFETDIWSMPVQRPYNPNSKRIAEMIQSDWAKVGVKAKIVTWVGPVSGRAAQRRTAERAVRLGVGQRRSGQLRHPARLRRGAERRQRGALVR